MVIHDLRAHHRQEFIKALCGGALKKRIGLARGSDAVDDLAAVVIRPHHLVHRVYVVLTVAVYRDAYIAHILCLHETGEHGGLMTAVAALAYADEMLVAACKGAYYLPGVVAAAVVNEHDAAVVGNEPLRGKVLYLSEKLRRGYRQYLLLVVARYNNVQNRTLHCFLLLF